MAVAFVISFRTGRVSDAELLLTVCMRLSGQHQCKSSTLLSAEMLLVFLTGMCTGAVLCEQQQPVSVLLK